MRPILLIAATLTCLACSNVKATPPPTAPKAEPPKADRTPFAWALQLSSDDGKQAVRLARKAERLDLGGWTCAHSPVKASSDSKMYAESMDLLCQSQSGAVAATRALCFREGGKVESDVAVLAIGSKDSEGLLTLALICDDAKVLSVEGQAREPAPASEPSTPFFEQPRTLDI